MYRTRLYYHGRSRWLTVLLRCTRLSSLLAAVSLFSGCLTAVAPNPSNTASSTTTDQWESLAPGLERRTYRPSPDNLLAQLVALRIDPAYYTFRVHYQPGDPLNLRRWETALPNAAAIVNANFFDPQNHTLGLLIADGVMYGHSFTDRGGTMFVQNGIPGVRSNLTQPYAGEAFEQAVQAFPMLVVDGAASYTNPNDADSSRRTAVAQDDAGRIILLATPLIGLRLTELSEFLATSDMNILAALNLDGGGSTMLFIRAGDRPYYLQAFDPVPAVLAVYPRSD